MNYKAGRNSPCPCGSGKKYKKCCLSSRSVVVGNKMLYQRLRETEGRIMHKIENFFESEYSHYELVEAWHEFQLWPEDDEELIDLLEAEEVEYMFQVYLQFHWLLVNTDNAHSPEDKVAEVFLQKKSVNPLEKKFVQTAMASPWCFYQILSVVEGESVLLKNLLSDEKIIVTERQASEPQNVGVMLFTTVVQMQNVAMMLGPAPYIFNGNQILEIIDFKEAVCAEKGKFTKEQLFDFQEDLFDFYWCFREQLLNPVMPSIRNTDGDDLEFHRLIYTINCPIDKVLEKMKKLTIDWDDEEFKQASKFSSSGELTEIQFPWLKSNPSISDILEHTVLGQITLKQKSLEIEVNSRKRATSMKRRISARFKKSEVKFLVDEIQALSQLMENLEPSSSKPELESPELVAVKDELEKKHLKNWIDLKIPALDELTPIEAVKTSQGRSRVESLISSFTFQNFENKQWLFKALEIDLDN